jgi:hypothetical protein
LFLSFLPCSYFFFHPLLLPLTVNHWHTLHFFATLCLLLLMLLLLLLPPPPLTSGWGLLYGVCSQPTHSIVHLLLSG